VLADEDEGCPCGRTLPKIQDVGGRITDYLKLSGGRYVSCTGLTSTVFPETKGIIQSRVIQSEQDKIRVQIVKNEDFDDNSIKMLRNEFAKILGEKISVEFEFPEKIEREKSGKYRFAISEVAE